MARRVEAVVAGHVQGVGFRWFVQREAQALGVAGWVRNEPDGTVSLVAEGPQEALDALVARLHEGPPSASVASMRTVWGEALGASPPFVIEW